MNIWFHLEESVYIPHLKCDVGCPNARPRIHNFVYAGGKADALLCSLDADHPCHECLDADNCEEGSRSLPIKSHTPGTNSRSLL